MGPLRAITISIALSIAGPAHADCEATRANLAADAARAEQWNLGWSLGFTGAAIGQAALAFTPIIDHDQRVGLWVGAAKSSIGALVHWILPLHIATPTSCEDARAIRDRAARKERRLFWLNHLGGFAINAGAAVLLADMTTWRTGLTSFLVGYPVSLLAAYTVPRASWHEVRAISAVPHDGGALLVLAGEF